MSNDILKEQVISLRNQGFSIREAAKELGVTKYAVEKAVKELESDSLQTLSVTGAAEPQTGRQTDQYEAQTLVQTLPDVAQTVQTQGNQGQRTGAGAPSIPSFGAETVLETQLNAAENTQIVPKKGYFYGVYTFMSQYRTLLKELHRGVQQRRSVWQHKIGGKYLKQVEQLRGQAQRHCQEQGVNYDSLLLSEVLDACEVYLREKALTAPVEATALGLSMIKFPQDIALVELLSTAKDGDFFSNSKALG